MATTTAYTNITNCFTGAAAVNALFAGFNKTIGAANLSYYIINGTAGNVIKVFDCGSNYSVGNTTDIGQVYETTIFARPTTPSNYGNISFYTVPLHNNTIPPCEYVVDGSNVGLPTTVLLGYHQWAGRMLVTPGTTGVVTGFNKLYITSDN
jgi:hypothetical protein